MIDETKINLDLGNKKFGSGKTGSGKKIFATKKVNKSYVVVLGIVALFVLMVIYIFNLEDTTKINDDVNSNNKEVVNQFDMSKIEAAQTNTQALPTPIPQSNVNQFDMSKIEAAQNTELAKVEQAQAEIMQKVEVENSFKAADLKIIEDENLDLKNQIEKLKKEIRDLKAQSSLNKSDTPKSNNENEVDKNKISSDDMKNYLNSIKGNIKLRGDNFNFDGKNYYIGDKIKTYQIRDIQKSSIRFCDDWCYTLIF